jgi:sulfur-oxidizing protein SoxZ
VGHAIAKNPFLSFKFKGGAKGDKIEITWVDNRGEKRTDETVVG